MFEGFSIDEDLSEMIHGQCAVWLHIGRLTLDEVIALAQTHAAGCQVKQSHPGGKIRV